MKPFFIFATLLLLVSCEEKEKPVQFEIVSETNYSFPAAMNTASFAITSNIPWQVTLKNGGDWCSVTPASANGDGNVEIFVAENTAYTQERTANIVVTAGDFSKQITVTQAPPPCPGFNPGAIAAAGQTICSGDAVSTITSSADAFGGNGNITYEWRENGIAIASTNAAAYSPSYNTTAGAHIFTRWTKDGACATDWTQSAGQWVLTVNDTPTITLLSGNANQTVKQGEAIDAIIYTTANATGASLSSGTLPSGVTGSWSANTYTMSGTISAAAAMQTYNYTVATTNSHGCTNDVKTGQIVVQIGILISTGGPNTARTTTTWVIGSQTWSDAIHIPACNKSSFTDSYTDPHCRSYTESGTTRYYYNWPYVNQNAATLCPLPWRVPSQSDFSALVSNTNYTDLMNMNAWGYGGFAGGSSMYNVSSDAFYWSATENSTTGAYNLYFRTDGHVYPQNGNGKLAGMQVRCVK